MTKGNTELLRAFIAVPLPAALQQRLSQLLQQLKAALPELKPAAAHNLHLTLHFLGEQTQEQLAEIGRLMVSIGEKKKNFNVTIRNLGCFPGLRNPRVLWLGLEPPDQLIALHRELASGLQLLGLLNDVRPYRPHLTLGRFKVPRANPEALCPFLSQEFGNLKIDQLVLYSSRLTAAGAVHSPLQRVILGTAH